MPLFAGVFCRRTLLMMLALVLLRSSPLVVFLGPHERRALPGRSGGRARLPHFRSGGRAVWHEHLLPGETCHIWKTFQGDVR